jgi:hypothetical protein
MMRDTIINILGSVLQATVRSNPPNDSVIQPHGHSSIQRRTAIHPLWHPVATPNTRGSSKRPPGLTTPASTASTYISTSYCRCSTPLLQLSASTHSNRAECTQLISGRHQRHGGLAQTMACSQKSAKPETPGPTIPGASNAATGRINQGLAHDSITASE